MTFLGGTSTAAVTQATIAHIDAHPTRRVLAVGNHEFFGELWHLGVAPERRLSFVAVGPDISPGYSHMNLMSHWRDDPDELIFQFPDARFLRKHPVAQRDQINIAWDCGHHATCGIVASSVDDMHSQVSAVLNGFRYGVYSRQIGSIDVRYEGQDTSPHFREAFLADPSSNIYWARDRLM
ncbi:hypothetical protein HFN89_05920 [Rhizobium laguerreae]|nr:hypothetical protein [Rhizobium laguerreae]